MVKKQNDCVLPYSKLLRFSLILKWCNYKYYVFRIIIFFYWHELFYSIAFWSFNKNSFASAPKCWSPRLSSSFCSFILFDFEERKKDIPLLLQFWYYFTFISCLLKPGKKWELMAFILSVFVLTIKLLHFSSHKSTCTSTVKPHYIWSFYFKTLNIRDY